MRHSSVVRQTRAFISDHPGGALALRCDGGVNFLSEDTDFDPLKYVAIRFDGQTIKNNPLQ